MSANTELVHEFIAAWNANDVDRVMTFFAEDCVYHNIPVPPVSGVAAIRGVIEGFAGMAREIDWVLHRVAEANDGVVLTERTDRFLIGEKWIELPVMGSFEVRDGKLSAWRDYFDMAQFQKQLPSA